MAAGDFLDLQTQLARIAGRDTAEDLDEYLDLCKQAINEAYLACYNVAQHDGTFSVPPWARQPFGLYFRAPTSAAIGVTQGSKVFTGYVPTADMVGSTFKIGSNTYTYAGQDGASHEFVEPVIEASGAYTATIYHDSQPIDARSVSVVGSPERKGFGLLSPMSNRETELKYRSSVSGDFSPTAGYGSSGTRSVSFGGINFETGAPLFWRIDSAQLLPGTAIRERLVLYPAPDQATVIRFDADIIPAELTADTDRPLLKGDLVSRILLPMARARWVMMNKKIAIDNASRAGLIEAGTRAESLLATLSQTQRRFSGRAVAAR